MEIIYARASRTLAIAFFAGFIVCGLYYVLEMYLQIAYNHDWVSAVLHWRPDLRYAGTVVWAALLYSAVYEAQLLTWNVPPLVRGAASGFAFWVLSAVLVHMKFTTAVVQSGIGGPLGAVLWICYGTFFAVLHNGWERIADALSDHVLLPFGTEVRKVMITVVTIARSSRKMEDLINILQERFSTVDYNEVVSMTSQFAVLFHAGVSVQRSIDILAKQSLNPVLKKAMNSVRDSVENGHRLSKAMSRFPAVFNQIYIGLITVGEETGALDKTLETLWLYLEREQNLVKKAKSAFTYPAVIMIVCGGVVWGLFTFIVPTLLNTFAGLAGPGTVLPLPTRILQFFVAVCSYRGLQLSVAVGGVILWLFASELVKTRAGRLMVDKWKLFVPLIGALNRKIMFARYFRTLGTLLGHGLDVINCCQILSSTFDNQYFRKFSIEVMVKRIKEGENMSTIWRADPLFPKMAGLMAEVGERSGDLDHLLIKLADYFDEEVERTLETLLTLLEPCLIFVMGIIVSFVLLGVFLPLYQVVAAFT